MVKPRDWALVRLVCSAGNLPRISSSNVGLPTSAGRSLPSLLFRSLPGEVDGVGGVPLAPPRPRLQVLPLTPRALRVAPGSTPPSCRGRNRPSLPSSLCLDLTRPPARVLPRCRLPSSVTGGSFCGGTRGAEGTCCQVTFRVVSMEGGQ